RRPKRNLPDESSREFREFMSCVPGKANETISFDRRYVYRSVDGALGARRSKLPDAEIFNTVHSHRTDGCTFLEGSVGRTSDNRKRVLLCAQALWHTSCWKKASR